MEIMQGEVHSGLKAKNGFHIFKGKKFKRSILFHDTWKLCEIEVSVSISRVLLVHSHTHLPMCYLCSICSGRVE